MQWLAPCTKLRIFQIVFIYLRLVVVSDYDRNSQLLLYHCENSDIVEIEEHDSRVLYAKYCPEGKNSQHLEMQPKPGTSVM